MCVCVSRLCVNDATATMPHSRPQSPKVCATDAVVVVDVLTSQSICCAALSSLHSAAYHDRRPFGRMRAPKKNTSSHIRWCWCVCWIVCFWTHDARYTWRSPLAQWYDIKIPNTRHTHKYKRIRSCSISRETPPHSHIKPRIRSTAYIIITLASRAQPQHGTFMYAQTDAPHLMQ